MATVYILQPQLQIVKGKQQKLDNALREFVKQGIVEKYDGCSEDAYLILFYSLYYP